MSEYIFAWALEKRIERRDFLVCFTFTLQFQKSPTQQPNIIEKTETTVVLIVLYGILYHIRRAAKIIFAPQGKRKLSPPPPPPFLQIMILKLSPQRCVISKESVQQKWIDELWFILFALLKVHPRFYSPRLACGSPELMGPEAPPLSVGLHIRAILLPFLAIRSTTIIRYNEYVSCIRSCLNNTDVCLTP